MRNLHELDQYRLTDERIIASYGSTGDETCGAFQVPSPVNGEPLQIVASAGLGWDHVSVSKRRRTPTWGEMEHVKRLFFRPDEVAMQLHVPEAEHINLHPNCLHLWRSQTHEIPLPMNIMV